MLTAAHTKPTPQVIRPTFEPLLDLQEAALVLGMHWKTLETKARHREVPGVQGWKTLAFSPEFAQFVAGPWHKLEYNRSGRCD